MDVTLPAAYLSQSSSAALLLQDRSAPGLSNWSKSSSAREAARVSQSSQSRAGPTPSAPTPPFSGGFWYDTVHP